MRGLVHLPPVQGWHRLPPLLLRRTRQTLHEVCVIPEDRMLVKLPSPVGDSFGLRQRLIPSANRRRD